MGLIYLRDRATIAIIYEFVYSPLSTINLLAFCMGKLALFVKVWDPN